jgi:hypothetical protein
MRAGVTLSVSSADLDRLGALVSDRNAPQKHVWRVRIVLLTAEGVGTSAIIRASCRRWAGLRFRRGTWRRWRHTFGPSAMRESHEAPRIARRAINGRAFPMRRRRLCSEAAVYGSEHEQLPLCSPPGLNFKKKSEPSDEARG